MDFLLSAIIGYLAGSLPSAYIVLKKTKGIDITSAGSGNVGAMNSFEISNSKLTGALVLLLDALKGLLSVYIPLILFPINFIYPALGLIFAVFSHCYNPWLGFKGGRGLATCAGGSFLLFPFLLVAWLALWVLIYIIRKDILAANIFATLLSLIVVFIEADTSLKYSYPTADSVSAIILFSSGVLLIIFTKHIDPFKDILNNFSIITPKGKDEK